MPMVNLLKRVAAEMEVSAMSEEDAQELGEGIGIDWGSVEFQPSDLLEGMQVELEHGTKNADTDITGDDPEETAKIAWVHLLETPDYYRLLKKHVESPEA